VRARPIQRWLLYAALWLLPIGFLPGASSVYPRLIHAEGNRLFAAFGSGRSIAFSWVDPSARADRSDTRMQGWVEGEPTRRWRAVFSLRRRGYWPSAVFAALLFATPMSARRRALALPGGLACLNLLLFAQLAFLGSCAFAASGLDGSCWRALLPVAQGSFNSPVPSYVWVFVLWVLLAQPSAGLEVSDTLRFSRRRGSAR
jgi:hypothetical protein